MRQSYKDDCLRLEFPRTKQKHKAESTKRAKETWLIHGISKGKVPRMAHAVEKRARTIKLDHGSISLWGGRKHVNKKIQKFAQART
jgi:hypothetical protein